MGVEPLGLGLRPGRTIAGKYLIEHVIAEGGQGTVIAAVHLPLKQRVAIKIPHLGEDNRAEPVARLFREARAVFRMQSEHVARVVDVDLVDGAPFIVMEYLDGFDLKALLARRGPLPVPEAVGLLLQACDAVNEAHDLGIIHRDLKPPNLFVLTRNDPVPLLKVLDFGLSKSDELRGTSEDLDLTHPALMLGSPRYMSPEQVRDAHDVDARSDIWGLGVVFQEMLTGVPVFRARDEKEVIAQILKRDPMPLSLLRSDVPVEIERVVWRCIQRQREHRFQSVRELVRALAPFAPAWAAINVQRVLRGEALPNEGDGGFVSTGTRGEGIGISVGVAPPAPAAVAPLEARRSFSWLVGTGAVVLAAGLAASVMAFGASRGAASFAGPRPPLPPGPATTPAATAPGATAATTPTVRSTNVELIRPPQPPASPTPTVAPAPAAASPSVGGGREPRRKRDVARALRRKPAVAVPASNAEVAAGPAPSEPPSITDPLEGRR